MKEIRVLVVDDSAFMRKMLTNIIQSDTRLKVIGTARDGKEALGKIVSLKPDVMTLDIEMPVMNGITVLQEVMSQHPLPVIMVSSLTQKSADMTVRALELGAVDFIAKPSGSISLDIEKVSEEIVSKVIIAATSNVPNFKKSFNEKKEIYTPKRTIIGIGTSTGGPKALQQVLPLLPYNFPFPIVIVQHMPAGFTKSLAQRLNTLSAITVKEAEDGEQLRKGTAYIGPGGYQFRIAKSGSEFVCQITEETIKTPHCPSVDILFNSLAELEKIKVVSIIMTGMGSDGTEGLLNLKKEKPDTYAISESAATSVVYGMPQSAKKAGVIDREEDLPNISTSLIKALSNPKEGITWN